MSSSDYNRYHDYPEEPFAFSSDEEGICNEASYHADCDPRLSSRKMKRNSKLNSSVGKTKTGHNSSTVSLSDFQKTYLYEKNHRVSEFGSNFQEREASSSVLSHVVKCKRWLESASTIKVALVGCLLGLVTAVMYQGVLHLGSKNRGMDNLLQCPSDELCLESSQLRPALLLAESIRDHLHIRAGQFECGVKSVTSRNMSLEDLLQQLHEEDDNSPVVLKNTMLLVLHNPHWGIRWFDRDGYNMTKWNSPQPTDILESTQPRLTWRCYASLTLSPVWSWLRLIAIILVAVVMVATVLTWYLVAREQKKKAVYLMVDKIINLLKKHYATCSREKDLLPYLAIIHVRDTLIPPSERKLKQAVWTKACEWISTYESRVRVENRRIAGEDFLVWRWIQEDPPQTEEPSLTAQTPGASPKADIEKGKDWSQWTAIDHYGPRVGDKVAPPVGTPSPHIRLKNMFETIRMDDEQAKQIENSVLNRCLPHGALVHIYVDRKSTFGCVYLKMDSLASASKAYRALHGGWYNGKLVTAKYIEASRYNKWFPHAANAKQQLFPS